jgi:hypothetical protein
MSWYFKILFIIQNDKQNFSLSDLVVNQLKYIKNIGNAGRQRESETPGA